LEKSALSNKDWTSRGPLFHRRIAALLAGRIDDASQGLVGPVLLTPVVASRMTRREGEVRSRGVTKIGGQ
jgi:hypothetical protein